jgi:glycyl-tRNA synthetase (class II)
MKKEEASIFMYYHKNSQIIQDVLWDGKNDLLIYCTINESTYLTDSVDYITSVLENLKKGVGYYPLKEKYLDIILEATNILKDSKGIQFNTFQIFYDLFKYTFTGNKNDEMYLRPKKEMEDFNNVTKQFYQ